MKTILSFIVLAMAVLVMGCGEPATTDASPDSKPTASADAEGCSCCADCEKCNDGEKCECTAKKGETCDCKCAAKDGEGSANKDDHAEEGHGHEDGDDHKDGDDHE